MSVFERSERLVVVGHRGCGASQLGGDDGGRGPDWPLENTFAAFERALSEGADAIELDVRLCATGEVVVFHDPDLERMSGGGDPREVRHVPYLELATRHRVPLLREVLAFCNDRRAGLNVEVKYDAVDKARLVARVAAELDAFPRADVLVSSFDPTVLARLGARVRGLRLAMLTTTERWWSLPLALSLAAARRVFAVHFERAQAKPWVVRAVAARGVRVGVWTVNDPAEARALRALGASWVITDRPGAMTMLR